MDKLVIIKRRNVLSQLMQMVASFAHIAKCGLGLEMVECRTLFCDTMILHNVRLTLKRRRHKKALKKPSRMHCMQSNKMMGISCCEPWGVLRDYMQHKTQITYIFCGASVELKRILHKAGPL